MTTDTELRELAERAAPGPWRADASEPDDVVIWAAGDDWLANVGAGLVPEQEAANAAYIAAAAPDTVIALLDRLRDFAATWHTANGHDGHLDDCRWTTCLGLLTGSIDSGSALLGKAEQE